MDNSTFLVNLNYTRSGATYIVYTGILPNVTSTITFNRKIRKDNNCDVYDGNAYYSTLQYNGSGVFGRIWRGACPHRLTPNGDGNLDIFYCSLWSPYKDICWDPDSPDHTLKSSVYKIKLEIFDRWGGRIWEDRAHVPPTSPFGLDGSEVSWDGSTPKGDALPGVYIAKFTFYSCSDNSAYQGCSDPSGNSTWYSESNIQIETIDVTLIR